MAISRKRNHRRSRRTEHSIEAALGRWRDSEVDAALPSITLSADRGPRTQPGAGRIGTVLRLVIWIWAGVRFYLGIFADKVMRRDAPARRAARLRRIFEGLGPTFIKVAQQLSVRADLLAMEYCRELSQMLDSVPPFPLKVAREIIERATGAPMAEVFQDFSTEPIGSASLACVYKARLNSGEAVAVKVRRPGIARKLARDVTALGWLLKLAEWLSLFTPGFTKTLHSEFARMLFEEIDFLREARNTELFRSEAVRAKHNYITAPRVHFQLCSEEVLVIDLVTGVFLKDVLAALDRGDEAELQRIRAQNIDLQEVARRLVMSAHWELLEGLLFHADPHPANICVQPGSILVFVDFGSCGRLTGKYRRIWSRFYQALAGDDVQAMVRSAIAILEPLPPIDVESFSREVEVMFWDWVHAMHSEHSAWWEKASGMLWMKFADAARRYQAPMSSEIVRIFRARFIYDTTIFRLWEQLDMRDEFLRYQREAGKRVKRRLRRAFWGRVEKGLKDSDYLELDELWQIGRQAIRRVQHFLDIPAPDFGRTIGKLWYSMGLLFRLISFGLMVYAFALVVSGGYALATGRHVYPLSVISKLAANPLFSLGLGALALILIRKMIKKFDEFEGYDSKLRG
jgi:ubiquinone biosynthesis protein